jgi:hypothetical protein
MKLAEGRLNQIVREMLHEDLQGFLNRTADTDYGVDTDNPAFEGEPESRDLARSVKRAWAAEADHKFMDSVTKVHWMKAATDNNIRRIFSVSNRDEISAMGYVRGPYNSGPDRWPVWGKIGFVIEGRTTLAANDMNSIFSGYHKNIPDDVRAKYRSSGMRKRPVGFNRWKAEDYILDAASFDISKQGENEFIVSHWKVTGVVLTESESHELAEAYRGKEVPEWQAAEWDRIFGLINELGIPYHMRKHKNLVQAWLDRRTSSGAGMKVTESRMRQIIREEAVRVLREGDDSPVLYTGIVLDDTVVEDLRSMIEELGLDGDVDGWETSNIAAHGNEQLNHHMTVTVGALKPDNPLRDELDEEVPLRVIGWGIDPDLGVAAWKVEPPSSIPVKTGNPHITAALRDSSVKPFQASKIKNWTPLDEPFMIVGRLQEVRPRS